MWEDTNIKGADTESDFWLIIYSEITLIRVITSSNVIMQMIYCSVYDGANDLL